MTLNKSSEVLEDIAPFTGETTELWSLGIDAAADLMETAADIEEKGIAQGLKNGSIRASFFGLNRLLNKFDSGLENGDEATKFGLGKLLNAGKEKFIEDSNSKYYESLKLTKNINTPEKSTKTTKAEF